MFGDSEVSTTFAAANTGVAQLVEHRSPKPGVGSSSLLPCNKKTANSRQAICGFLIIASQISYYSRLSLKTLSYTNSYSSSFPIL